MEFKNLSDTQLTTQFRDLVIEETENLVLQLEHIGELDRRKLFQHYPSLWACLVHEYGMEEWKAERMTRAARILKRFPEIKSRLETAKLNLSLLDLAQSCANREKLSDDEFLEVIEAVSGKTCRAAKKEIASRFPESDQIPHDRIRPLTEELSEVRFIATNELLDKLEEIRGLLAHSHSNLKMGELIDVLATEYRERYHPEEKAKRAREREKKKENNQPILSPVSTQVTRTPSQSLINQLILKNGYICSYIDPLTRQKCTSKHALEIDHIQAWSKNGKTELQNLRFLCRNHHARVSYLDFGENSKYR